MSSRVFIIESFMLFHIIDEHREEENIMRDTYNEARDYDGYNDREPSRNGGFYFEADPYEECCLNCRFFRYRTCEIVDEFDDPSPDGSDCCDKFEPR